jgi:uncharacterized membrane-anchored protein
VLEIIEKIIENMPFYVWIILGYLVWRIYKLTKPGTVVMVKQIILPLIFIIWGIERVFAGFTHVDTALIAYFIIALVGTGAGYLVYSRFSKFFIKDGGIWRGPAWTAIVVIVLNVIVKFYLNIQMGYHPEIVNDLNFDIEYCLISDFTVGLFIGGIINTYLNKKALEANNKNST